MKTKSKVLRLTRGSLFQPVPIVNLVNAPLRELFWGLPESSLLDEAKARLEEALRTALPCDTVQACAEPLSVAA